MGRGTKLPSNGHDHMTKMATMPVYGKTFKKSSSLEPNSQWSWNLVCSVGYSSTTKLLQMMTLDWPWPIFKARSNLAPYASVWAKVKTMDFLETIVVYDIKVGRWSQLNEYMKFYAIQRSRSFTDLGPNYSDLIFSNFFSSITAKLTEAKFHVWTSWIGRTKVCSNGHVTWPRWPPCPYMVKTSKKTSSSKPKGWWPWNLICSIWYSSTIKFVPVVLFDTPGISRCRSQHVVSVESSSFFHHSIYPWFICFPWWSIDELENLHGDRITNYMFWAITEAEGEVGIP